MNILHLINVHNIQYKITSLIFPKPQLNYFRLKNWLASQADREKETADRKRRKLERMCEEPKHEFKDDAYFKEISELPKRVEDAVLQGLEASSSMKRLSENDTTKKTKKRKLW